MAAKKKKPEPAPQQNPDWRRAAQEAVNPDEFTTPLTPEQVQAYLDWKAKYAHPQDEGYDYDLPGAFLAGLKPDRKSGHWPDTFKKPNHETFSNESQYAAARPDLAGSWSGETFFQPIKPYGEQFGPPLAPDALQADLQRRMRR